GRGRRSSFATRRTRRPSSSHTALPPRPRAASSSTTSNSPPQRRRLGRMGGAAVEAAAGLDVEALRAIEQRVLWLAVRIVDYANRERPKGDALKVGGHQASSASMVSLMTALYIVDLTAADRVSVKPHASPVLHALEYLLG